MLLGERDLACDITRGNVSDMAIIAYPCIAMLPGLQIRDFQSDSS